MIGLQSHSAAEEIRTLFEECRAELSRLHNTLAEFQRINSDNWEILRKPIEAPPVEAGTQLSSPFLDLIGSKGRRQRVRKNHK